MKSGFGNNSGNGTVKFLLTLLVFIAIIYLAYKFGKPYLAYKDLQGTMQYWADITVHRRDHNYSDLMLNIENKIDQYDIPLDMDDIQIEYDREEKSFLVYSEYYHCVDIYLSEFCYHFTPLAEVVTGD